MLRRVRETAPAGLVPAAWTLALAAGVGAVDVRPVLVAHLVMDVVLVAFLVLSWADMREGVLRAWRLVILVGVPVTLAGTVGLATAGSPASSPLVAVSLVGWTLLPAPALWYTGVRAGAEGHSAAATVNRAAAALSAGGGLAFAAALVAGVTPDAPLRLVPLALVGVGQTAGIVDAVVRYD